MFEDPFGPIFAQLTADTEQTNDQPDTSDPAPASDTTQEA